MQHLLRAAILSRPRFAIIGALALVGCRASVPQPLPPAEGTTIRPTTSSVRARPTASNARIALAPPARSMPFVVRQSSWKMLFGRAEPPPASIAPAPPRRWFEDGFDDVRWPMRGLRPGLVFFQPPLLSATPPPPPVDLEPGQLQPPGAAIDEDTAVKTLAAGDELPTMAFFRKRFTVVDRRALAALVLDVKRGEGITVHINGKLAAQDDRALRPPLRLRSARLRAPAATAPGTTTTAPAKPPARTPSRASSVAQALGPWPAHSFRVCLSPDLLVDGENLIAVEVQQHAPGTGDLSFDLDLTGRDRASLLRGPYLQVGTPSSGIIRWRTDCPSDSRVQVTLPDGTTRMVEDAAPVTEHEITVKDLAPGTRYGYAIGASSGGGPLWLAGDDDTYFVTAPSAGKPTRIWVLGDSGTKDDRPAAVRDAYAAFSVDRPTDLMLMLGDNAYDRGTDLEFQEAVFDVFGGFMRHTFLWPALGNHETSQAHEAARVAASPYFQIFTLPRAGEAGGLPSGSENYYSFDHGDIHFVCLDSMTTSSEPLRTARTYPPAMLRWLDEDLAARTKPWLIAFLHHPPYTKGSHDSDSNADYESGLLRKTVLPVLEAHGVDLVMSGHSHVYERSFLLAGHFGNSQSFSASMKKGAGSGRPSDGGPYVKPASGTTPGGAVYVVAGSSGQSSPRGARLNHPAFFIAMARIGSLVLDIDGKRLDARFLRDTSFVEDHFTMHKGPLDRPLPRIDLSSSASQAPIAIGTPVKLGAHVASGGAIARVDFYRSPRELIASDREPPFETTWTPTTPGAYQIIAEAVDDRGAWAMGAPLVVNVAAP